MHELFLTAVVADADLERAQAVLQGLTGMTAHAGLRRVLYFAGPATQPRGLSVSTSLPKPLTQGNLWRELHQQLSRQSFVVQVRYPLQARDFAAADGDGVGDGVNDGVGVGGGSSSSMSGNAADAFQRFNATPGTLRWTDIPDPTGSGISSSSIRLVMQRKKIEIAETQNLPQILQDNQYRFKSELIEESFSFFADNTEYALVRYHLLPKSPAAAAAGTASVPLRALPPLDSVIATAGGSRADATTTTTTTTATSAVDPSHQWLLFVRRQVVDDTAPEKTAKAVDELDAVRTQLAGVFAFRPVDRRAHDTRIERPVNNMPIPLPQKVLA